MVRNKAWNIVSPFFFLLTLSSINTQTSAQSGPELRTLPAPVPAPEVIPEKPLTLEDLVKQIIIEAVDDDYVDDKEWGNTTKVFDGFRTSGLRISKKTKQIEHGLWQRYKASLIKPDETLKISITQLENPLSDKTQYSIGLIVRARCEGTLVNWFYGAKGINATTVADTTIRINIFLSIDPQTSFSFADPIPEFNLNPTVERVDLALKDIDVRRIGIFHGPGVEAMGDASRKTIEKLMEQQERKIRAKLQKKLDEI